MQLSAHFSLAEFTASDTAARRGIDNSLPTLLMPAAQATADMMERIRAYLSAKAGRDVPINITSGYRSLAVNAAVGSDSTSDHPKALAVDFKAPEFGTAAQVAYCLSQAVDTLGIGQVIAEYSAWTHVSTRTPGKGTNRLLTINSTGATSGIVLA